MRYRRDLTSGNYLQGTTSRPGRVFVRARVEGLLWDQHGDVEGVVLEKEQLRVKAPWVAARHGSAMWKVHGDFSGDWMANMWMVNDG